MASMLTSLVGDELGATVDSSLGHCFCLRIEARSLGYIDALVNRHVLKHFEYDLVGEIMEGNAHR